VRLLLVPSPFLGPVTWMPVARLLRAAGHEVAESAPGPLDAPPFRPVFVEAAVRAAASGVDALVGYSGSGPLLPEIAARLGGARAAVFVDAALPHLPVPPARMEALRALAVDGWLPPWHEWFPPSAVRDLVPDDRARARFVAGLRPFPLAYFDEPPSVLGESAPAGSEPGAGAAPRGSGRDGSGPGAGAAPRGSGRDGSEPGAGAAPRGSGRDQSVPPTAGSGPMSAGTPGVASDTSAAAPDGKSAIGWPPPMCGYLQLSAAYDAEAAEGRRLGWATLRLDLDHLAPLTRPEPVASAIGRLLAA
jgi:hypothetical protein